MAITLVSIVIASRINWLAYRLLKLFDTDPKSLSIVGAIVDATLAFILSLSTDELPIVKFLLPTIFPVTRFFVVDTFESNDNTLFAVVKFIGPTLLLIVLPINVILPVDTSKASI